MNKQPAELKVTKEKDAEKGKKEENMRETKRDKGEKTQTEKR